MEPAIDCQGVWKQYYFYAHRPRQIKELFVSLFRPRPVPDPVWALQDFSLRVEPGQTVGVVGNNGAGKSTLLKLISGILTPSRGTVRVRGRVTALIELGAGFHEDLTAHENLYLAGSLLGFSRRQVARMAGQIIEFSGLQDHLHTPLKYFSSGMHARLGFALAVGVDPDVLLIDEVLAVGDAAFRPRCREKIIEFQQRGKALLLVSHDMEAMRSVPSRVLWLKDGVTMAQGEPGQIVDAYLEHYWPGCTKKGKAVEAISESVLSPAPTADPVGSPGVAAAVTSPGAA